MRRSVRAFALALLLAGCGDVSTLPESSAEEREGTVASVEDASTFTIDTDDGAFTYQLREESTIIDGSGARRDAGALLPGTHVSVRARVSDSGRRSAERVTILHLVDPSLPSVIVPPEQD